jgi:elongation factor G
VPRVFWNSIEGAAKAAVRSGLDLGYPIVRVQLKVVDGEVREGETTEMALAAATSMAFTRAMEEGGVDILEPIMRFEVQTPAEFVRPILADLNSRRGRIANMDSGADPVSLKGTVPLAEIFGYSTALRSMSQGRANFTVEPADYLPVPSALARELRS